MVSWLVGPTTSCYSYSSTVYFLMYYVNPCNMHELRCRLKFVDQITIFMYVCEVYNITEKKVFSILIGEHNLNVFGTYCGPYIYIYIYIHTHTHINPAVGGLHISGLRIQLNFGLNVGSEMRSRGGEGGKIYDYHVVDTAVILLSDALRRPQFSCV